MPLVEVILHASEQETNASEQLQALTPEMPVVEMLLLHHAMVEAMSHAWEQEANASEPLQALTSGTPVVEVVLHV